ncbi:TIM barrel protein [Paenibacillus lignilyticus]|uniref:TIM barrel protein n=1 Tax=Paenibacillus lignilyticus TaxID=1172615 RepID=A0ABS5C6M9_9BACL|nr:TIM barrel protein [Paenibacillus lignilyticus]MBP3961563.1 TIM barrel protein [Paenibacillus lignilyticus]MBP3963767.1 TIM barrel protein [Paenibacillus lignilyticus]
MTTTARVALFPKGFMNELSDGTMSLWEWIEIAGTLGADGLEMYPRFLESTEPSYLLAVREACDKVRLAIPMMCSSPDFTQPDPALRREEIQHIKTMIDVMAILGPEDFRSCRVLSGQRRIEVSREDGIRWTVECIQELLEYAAEKKVVLVMENHYKDGYWTAPEFALPCDIYLEIISQIESPWFGVNYDPSNAIVAGYEPIRLLEQVRSRVITMHASDRYLKEGYSMDDIREFMDQGYSHALEHGVIGKGMNDYGMIFRILQEEKFAGWISIEDGVNGLEELEESVHFIKNQIKRYLSYSEVMKAIVLKNANSESAAVTLSEKPRPELKADHEVLIKVISVGLDGTDKEIIMHRYGVPPEGEEDLIIGHELIGVVEQAGAASGFNVGDAVTVLVRRPCPEPDCQNCRADRSDYCQSGNYIERGIKGSHGFMCEYVVEDADYVVKVPDGMSHLGVWVEPQSIFEKLWSTIAHFQQRFVWKPKRALVLGSGPMGLLSALSLRTMGIETHVWSLHAVDSLQANVLSKIGSQFQSAYNDSSVGAAEHGLARHYGSKRKLNFDIVLECTGFTPLLVEAAHLLNRNGIIGLLGISSTNRHIEVPMDQINQHFVIGNQCMVGSVNASKPDFIRAIDRIGQVERCYPGTLSSLITDEFTPEQVASVRFDRIGIKGVVRMS